nr:uncharacterized protein LOC117276916 [Nicotiana tomentosiformis]
MALALGVASRKLRPYVQFHPIAVVTTFHLGLELALGLVFEVIEIKYDSQLVVNQVYGICTVIQLMHSVLDVDGYCEVNTTNLVWYSRNEFINYLQHDKLPEGLLARCLGASEADYIMREVLEGIWGNHSGADSLVLKLVKAGYYLASNATDREDVHLKMRQMSTPCIVGASTGRTTAFGVVPMAIHEMRDGYSWAATTGSRKGSKVTKFFEDLKIKRITFSPYHPSENGQAESPNKVIIQNLKKRLEESKGKWTEELPGVLWAYRTTTKSSKGEKPFSLIYDTKALIPVEVGEQTLRYFRADEESNSEALLVKLELLDELRDLAHIRMVAQKQMMERYYNWRSNLGYFKVGDLVLRKVTQNTQEINVGKLGPTWEGPYRVSAVTGKGSYELENEDGVNLPSNWNVTHLKR